MLNARQVLKAAILRPAKNCQSVRNQAIVSLQLTIAWNPA